MATNYLLAGMIFQGGVGGGSSHWGGVGGGVGTRSPGSYIFINFSSHLPLFLKHISKAILRITSHKPALTFWRSQKIYIYMF